MPRRARVGSETGESSGVGLLPKRRRTTDQGEERSRRNAALGGADLQGRRRVISHEVFINNNKALQSIDSAKGSELKAESIDLHLKDNRAAHHTDEYELSYLIVRRGQPFLLSITFDREYSDTEDRVILQFITGSRPQESKGTLLRIPVTTEECKNPNEWHAQLVQHDYAVLSIAVTPSAEAVVGKYQLFVDTVTVNPDGSKYQYRHEFEDEICTLFNPWCSADDVYLELEEEREEYVMNESGRIWCGTAREPDPMAWNYGQFEDVCLEAALYLLDKAELKEGARGNPALVVRTISALANSNDDRGVLTGRWTEKFPKSSTVPWAWTGSVAILEKYMKRKKPVRYGQCWVFAGLVTTLLRALGVPTRCVTNFESAHDLDASMTIDFHWDENDKELSDLNDSIWNFHVWNESYCRRPDLPSGFDGWQVHDATPQEASEGVMRCGPSPHRAIREGLTYIPYDTSFIFAEVNGDKVHWLIREDGSMECISKEKNMIGLKITTKDINSNRAKDITQLYKYKEGSDEERAAVHRAYRHSSRREHDIYDIPEPDVVFQLITPEHVQIGDDFDLKVKMTNKASVERSVSLRVSLLVSFYTGIPSEPLAVLEFKEKIPPNLEAESVLSVSHQEYEHILKPETIIQVYLRGTVVDTKRSYAHIESFGFQKPKLKIEVPERVCLGEEFEVVMSLRNPLTDPLTNGELHIEAPGMAKDITIPCRSAIGPGEELMERVTLMARRAGKKEIIVRFTSDHLTGVTGTAEVYISYSS